jgi:hypothetical protein
MRPEDADEGPDAPVTSDDDETPRRTTSYDADAT